MLLAATATLALFTLAAVVWWLARGLWRACRGLSRGLQGPQGVQRQSGSIESATEPHKPAWALREPIEQKDAA